jgi:flagellar export protein FliJ
LSRDPLATLMRLRRAACDEAQINLVRRLGAETGAGRLAAELDRSIARETEAATDIAGSDAVVEAYAAWLPGARRRLTEARRTLEALQAETARARAELAACRTALESVETLQTQRHQAAQAERQRAWQRDLDDRPHRPRSRNADAG